MNQLFGISLFLWSLAFAQCNWCNLQIDVSKKVDFDTLKEIAIYNGSDTIRINDLIEKVNCCFLFLVMQNCDRPAWIQRAIYAIDCLPPDSIETFVLLYPAKHAQSAEKQLKHQTRCEIPLLGMITNPKGYLQTTPMILLVLPRYGEVISFYPMLYETKYLLHEALLEKISGKCPKQ